MTRRAPPKLTLPAAPAVDRQAERLARTLEGAGNMKRSMRLPAVARRVLRLRAIGSTPAAVVVARLADPRHPGLEMGREDVLQLLGEELHAAVAGRPPTPGTGELTSLMLPPAAIERLRRLAAVHGEGLGWIVARLLITG